jgi:hypothetical protein
MKHSQDWKVKKKILKRAGWTYEVLGAALRHGGVPKVSYIPQLT